MSVVLESYQSCWRMGENYCVHKKTAVVTVYSVYSTANSGSTYQQDPKTEEQIRHLLSGS